MWTANIRDALSGVTSFLQSTPRPTPAWSSDGALVAAARAMKPDPIRAAAATLARDHAKALAALERVRAPLVDALAAQRTALPALDARTRAELRKRKIPIVDAKSLDRQLRAATDDIAARLDQHATEHVAAQVGVLIAEAACRFLDGKAAKPIALGPLGLSGTKAEDALRAAWKAGDRTKIAKAAAALQRLGDKVPALAAAAARVDRQSPQALECGAMLQRLVDDVAVGAWSAWLFGWPPGSASTAGWESVRVQTALPRVTEVDATALATAKKRFKGQVAITGTVESFCTVGDQSAVTLHDAAHAVTCVTPSDLRRAGLAIGATARMVGAWRKNMLVLGTASDGWPPHDNVHANVPAATWAWSSGMRGSLAPLLTGSWYER